MLRRDFIKSASIVAGAMIAPVPLFGASERIKIGILGTGWWGTDFLLRTLLPCGQYEVVALCDVNALNLKNAASVVTSSGGDEPKLFSNYKHMYEVPGLQAVIIATPTHWHALQFIDACKKGLHVFLEKPISYDIREGQAMVEAHRKAKNVVLVDFPRVMVDTNSKVKQLISNGEIGKVMQAHANINNPEGEVVEKSVPATLDYETFCGPAPKAKFMCNPDGDKPNWRQQHDFSRGVMADWGIHYIHNIRKILDLDLPETVHATGGTIRNFSSDNPDYLNVSYNFKGLPVTWSHKAWGYSPIMPEHEIGVYYYGEKGTIFAGDLGYEIYTPGQTKKSTGNVAFNPGAPENQIVYTKMFVDMFLEFSEGIRQNSVKGITNKLDDAQKTTSTIIFGDIAFRTKSELQINTETLDVKNSKAAQSMLRRTYRAPYVHPAS